MKSKKTKVLVIILCLTMVYMTTVYAATGFSEDITQTKSIFTLPSNSVKGLFNEVIVKGRTITNLLSNDGESERTFLTSANTDTAIKTAMNLPVGKYLLFYELTETAGTNTRNTPKVTYTDDTTIFESVFANHNTSIGRKVWKIDATKAIKQVNYWCHTPDADVKVKDFMLVAVNETEYAYDTDVLLGMYNYINSTKSTLSGFLQIISQNKFNKDDLIYDLTVKNTDGTIVDGTGTYAYEPYTRVKPNTTYKTSDLGTATGSSIAFYDINKNFISSITLSALASASYQFTTPVNAYYKQTPVRVDTQDVNTIMIVEGTTLPTSFVKYELSEGSVNVSFNDGELTRIPNGNTDEVDVIKGVATQRNQKYALQSADIYDLNTTLTNVDLVYAKLPLDAKEFSTGAVNEGQVVVEGYIQWSTLSTGADDVANIGKHGTAQLSGYAVVVFFVAKGTYADITAARTALAGTSLIYQLATPETTIYNTAPLACYENGTIMVMPQVKESAAYNNGMSITNTNLPIKSLVRVDKIENGVLTPVDLSNATIAPDGLSFTISGAINDETYIYVYEYAPGLSTIPTITYSVPVNQDGQITGNTNAIQRHSDLIDIILQQIQLMRQEIQELKTMLQ